MKRWRTLFLFAGIVGFAFLAFPQVSSASSASNASKELKRTARRLHIPVDQLQKARQALQDATNLARQMKPFPISQVSSITQSWRQLNRSKVKEVMDAFMQDLRTEAASAADLKTYKQATSAAMSLAQSNGEMSGGHEKRLQFLQNWPEPPAAISDAGKKYLGGLESSIRQSALYSTVYSDPLKAKELLNEAGGPTARTYSITGQIISGLMNKGKKDDALALVNQTISDFIQHASDPQAIQAYQGFAQSTIRTLGSANATTILTPLITQLSNQSQSDNCVSGTMKVGKKTIDLTCSEYSAYNVIQGFQSMPGLVSSTLNSFPTLKTKVDQAGGIDDVFSHSGVSITPKVSESYLASIRSKANTSDGMDGMPFGPEMMAEMYGEGIDPEMMAGLYGGMDPMEMMDSMYGGDYPFPPGFDPGELDPETMAAIYGGGMPPYGMDDMPFYAGDVLPVPPPPDAQEGTKQDENAKADGSAKADGNAKADAGKKAENPAKLMKELKEKADTNPDYVRGRLREIAQGKRGLDTLMSLVSMSSYDETDLGSLALEVAKPLVLQVEPIEKRASYLQRLITASRQSEGDVPPDLYNNGFSLAEQLREKSKNPGNPTAAAKGSTPGAPQDIQSALRDAMAMSRAGVPEETIDAMMQQYEPAMMASMGMGMGMGLGMSSPIRGAEQLETFLVSELAKDYYEKAVSFAQSRQTDTHKLTCLIRIVQTLSRRDF
jgi:hypothetical protein